jgi:hypothetical protein
MLDTIERTNTADLSVNTAEPVTKQGKIAAELRNNPQLSDRKIAERVGCDHKTVGAWRARLETNSPPGNSAPTPTEFRGMLIEGVKDFDANVKPETAEEAVDNALAKGIVKPPLVPGSKCPPPPGVVDEPEEDFFSPDSTTMVIPHQPAIAVYENTLGAVVIRQEQDFGDDDGDRIITVRPEHVEKLIARLRQVAKEAMA